MAAAEGISFAESPSLILYYMKDCPGDWCRTDLHLKVPQSVVGWGGAVHAGGTATAGAAVDSNQPEIGYCVRPRDPLVGHKAFIARDDPAAFMY